MFKFILILIATLSLPAFAKTYDFYCATDYWGKQNLHIIFDEQDPLKSTYVDDYYGSKAIAGFYKGYTSYDNGQTQDISYELYFSYAKIGIYKYNLENESDFDLSGLYKCTRTISQ